MTDEIWLIYLRKLAALEGWKGLKCRKAAGQVKMDTRATRRLSVT